jgi:hypothetical protein
MSDILPVSTGIGFNNGNGFGADTMGAFAGALFGSWFGDAWGGNWGNRGVAGDAAATGFSTQILNDGINAIQNSVNNMNMNLSSGLCNVGYQNLDQNSRTNLAMMQGFATLGHDNCQNTNAIVSAVNGVGTQMQECCCSTQRLVEREACATRELIQAQYARALETKLCDAKDEISALKSNLYTQNAINASAANIIAHVKAMLPASTTGTASS